VLAGFTWWKFAGPDLRDGLEVSQKAFKQFSKMFHGVVSIPYQNIRKLRNRDRGWHRLAHELTACHPPGFGSFDKVESQGTKPSWRLHRN
jgi:hypothetical protein